MLHTKFQANCIIIPDKSPFNDDLSLKQNITKLGSEPLINRNILKELAYGFFSPILLRGKYQRNSSRHISEVHSHQKCRICVVKGCKITFKRRSYLSVKTCDQ